MIYEYSRRPPSVLQEKEVTDKTSLEKGRTTYLRFRTTFKSGRVRALTSLAPYSLIVQVEETRSTQ